QGILKQDYSRIQALMISDADMEALGMDATEATQLREKQKQAYAKFQATVAKLTNLNEKTRWLHLETAAPQCTPVEAATAKADVIRCPGATLLCETNGKHDWIQLGQLVKLGLAWRLTDAPGAGDEGGNPVVTAVDPALQGLLDQLRDHDAKAPKVD